MPAEKPLALASSFAKNAKSTSAPYAGLSYCAVNRLIKYKLAQCAVKNYAYPMNMLNGTTKSFQNALKLP